MIDRPAQTTLADQLRRFNEAREQQFGAQSPDHDKPLPLPRSGVGGDVGEPEE